MPQRLWAIVALSFGTGLVVVDGGIVNVALPTIARSLGRPPADAVTIVTLYQAVMLMALLPFAALGDRIGLKTLYQVGQATFLLATVLASIAPSFELLLAARACQSLGVAAALSVGTAQLRNIYPSDQLGRGLALNGIVIAASSALSPSVGGFLVALGSWRWVFAAAAPFALASLVLGRALPAIAPRRADFDTMGALLSAASFGLAMAAMQSVTHGGALPVAVTLAAAALLVGTTFVRREMGRERALLPVDLFGDKAFSLPVTANALTFAATTIFTLSLPFALEASFGWSPARIGLVLSIYPLAMVCSAPLAGSMVERVPGAAVCLVALGFLIAAMLTMGLATETLSVPLTLVGVALGGAGMGLFISPSSHQIMSAAPHDRSASAGATITTSRLVGSGIGAMAAATSMRLMGTPGMGAFAGAAAIAAASALTCFVRLRQGNAAARTWPAGSKP